MAMRTISFRGAGVVGALAAVVLVLGVTHQTPRAAAAAMQPVSGPNLTVVGFGLAHTPMTAGVGYQLTMNFQVSNPNIARALGDLESSVRHAVAAFVAAGIARSDIQAQSVNVNLNSNSVLQVNEPVTVDVASLAMVPRLEKVLSGGPTMVGLNNYYFGPIGGQAEPTPAALAAAYAQAWRNARATAAAIAQGEGLRLGPPLSELEGQAGTPCGMGGACPVVGYQGVIPAGDQLESLTVTFATDRSAP
jgi:uncharacterized protein YggE